MARIRSRVVETESVNQRMLRRGAVKRQHISSWAVGRDELAPGIVGETHLGPQIINETHLNPGTATGLRGAGRLLVATGTAVEVASGGAEVAFDTIVDQVGFDATAGDSWIHPVSAVYVLSYEHEWDTYIGGGTVELLVNGRVRRTLMSSDLGQGGAGVTSYIAPAGSTGSIRVTQDSGLVQTCSLTVQVALPDPEPVVGIVGISASATANLAESARPVTVTVDAPAGIQTGDVMLAMVFSIEPTITDPGGWTRLSLDAGPNDHRYALEWKAVVAADVGGSFSWTVDGGTAETEVMVTILALRGLTAASPLAGAHGFARGAVASVSPVATPTDARAIVVLAASRENPPGSADHEVPGMARQTFTGADSSNLHVAMSAFLTEDVQPTVDVQFGVTVFEGGAYLLGVK